MISLGSLYQKGKMCLFLFLMNGVFLAEILGLDVALEGGEGDSVEMYFYFVASPLGTVIFCRFGCSGSC